MSLIASEAPTATPIALPAPLPAMASAKPPASEVIDDESVALTSTVPAARTFEPLRIRACVLPLILLTESEPARLPATAVPVPETAAVPATPIVRA